METAIAVWVEKHLKEGVPFSFIYGEKSSCEFVSGWKRKMSVRRIDGNRTGLTVTHADPSTGLVVRCEAVTYRNFPVVEWTLYLKNAGGKDTPIIENLHPLDILLSRSELGDKGSSGSPVLHYAVGSPCRPEDYRPLKKRLSPGTAVPVATSGGRSCNAHMPYFNLEWKNTGLILAVGWNGQWAAEFKAERTGEMHLSAGQELTHFTLHPGEEVRTPLIALLFYRGDRIHSQNLWRRWLVAHNLPRPGGKLPGPMLSATSWFYSMPFGISNAHSFKSMLDEYEVRKISINHSWIDAGWYDCDPAIPVTGYPCWTFTGTWKPDRHRYPKGVREASDHAHKKGLKTVLWFEPERVMPGTWLYRKHPEWLIAPQVKLEGHNAYFPRAHLLNLGNPAALRWAIKMVSGLLKSEQIDVYREDFNIDPLEFWRASDAPDRQGITEIRHVTAHLALWDALRKKMPGLLIDVCASGGRRNDLESLRRAVPLWRSDYAVFSSQLKEKQMRINANQCITYGISFWIPYYGTGLTDVEHYRFSSCLSPSLLFDVDPRRDDVDAELWRKLADIHKKVAGCFLGDYYPLTDYSLTPSAWMAWQFDLPEKGEGMVQVFRREKNPRENRCFKLHALRPEAGYVVTDLKTGRSQRFSGRTLTEKGLPVRLPDKSSAVLLFYKRA